MREVYRHRPCGALAYGGPAAQDHECPRTTDPRSGWYGQAGSGWDLVPERPSKRLPPGTRILGPAPGPLGTTRPGTVWAEAPSPPDARSAGAHRWVIFDGERAAEAVRLNALEELPTDA